MIDMIRDKGTRRVTVQAIRCGVWVCATLTGRRRHTHSSRCDIIRAAIMTGDTVTGNTGMRQGRKCRGKTACVEVAKATVLLRWQVRCPLNEQRTGVVRRWQEIPGMTTLTTSDNIRVL